MSCLLAAACGSQTSSLRVQRALAANADRCAARSAPLGSERVAYAAVAARPLRAFRKPGRHPFARFGTLNRNGVPTVFGVRAVLTRGDCSRWYRVQLPRRPNGVEGWVRAADASSRRSGRASRSTSRRGA